jgi:hypothetical protein
MGSTHRQAKARGDRYERAIVRHYRKSGRWTVTPNVKLKSEKGVPYQVDILLTTEIDGMTFRIAVEAKDHAKALDQDRVLTIRKKFELIDVDRGIIYCSKGLQSGPIAELEGSRHPPIIVEERTYEQLIESNWADDFLDAIPLLKEAKAATSPTADQVVEVVEAIERLPHYARYFFHELDNPTWIPVLTDAGVLARAARNKTSIPPLMAAGYVCRFVKEFPSEFLSFANAVSDSFHWLEAALMKAALQLSPADRERFCAIAAHWKYSQGFDAETLVRLVRSCFSDGLEASGLALVSHATDLRVEAKYPNTPALASLMGLRSLIPDTSFYSVAQVFPKLAQTHSNLILPYLRERLIQATKLAYPDENHYLPSYLFQGLDDPHARPLDHLDSLAFVYRDAMLAATGTEGIAAVKAELKLGLFVPGLAILRRVALRVLLIRLSEFRQLISEVATNIGLWSDFSCSPELESLVIDHWNDLGTSVQLQTVRTIVELPIPQGRDPSAMEEWRDRTVFNWLQLIKPVGFPAGLKRRAASACRALELKLGPSEPTRHESHRVGLARGVSDVPSVELEEFTASDILDIVRGFEPHVEGRDERTPAGLARKLHREVVKRPREFLAERERILSLPYPAYHAAIVEGLTEALGREPAEVAALDVAGLAGEFLDASYRCEDEPRVRERFGLAPKVRRQVLRLVEEAQFTGGDEGISIPLFDALHSLAKRVESGQVGAEDASGEAELIDEYLSASLCRLLIHATFSSRDEHRPKAEREAWLLRVDELQTALETRAKKRSRAVLGPLGAFYGPLCFVDPQWENRVKRHLFPRQGTDWLWAWNGYLRFNERYPVAFRSLADVYKRTLVSLRATEKELPAWTDQFGQDFAIFFGTGELAPEDALLQQFWKDAPPQVRRSAAFWFNQALDHEEPERRPPWERCRTWWSQAVANAPKKSSDASDEHLSSYLFWLNKAPSSERISDVFEPLLVSIRAERRSYPTAILSFLSKRVTAEPLAAAQVLRAVAENERGDIPGYEQPRYRLLLRMIFEAGDADAMQEVRSALSALMRRSMFLFEETLTASIEKLSELDEE